MTFNPNLKRRYWPRLPKLAKCVICGNEIVTTRRDTKLCSPKCRQTASRHARGLLSLSADQEMHLVEHYNRKKENGPR